MNSEHNYHSSKGELAALHYSLFKLEHFLKQGPFTLWTDNMTVVHWETMKGLREKVAGGFYIFSVYSPAPTIPPPQLKAQRTLF